MNFLISKIKKINCAKWAVFSLLVLWAALTFSIALTEVSFVCALIFWVGWRIQLKKGVVVSALSTPGVNGGDSESKHRVFKIREIDWVFWAPLALFFLAVLISLFTSEYPKQSFRGLLKIAKPLLVFIMAIDLFSDARSQKRFDGIFLATFLLVTIDCSIQYAFGKDLLRGFAPEQSGSGIRLVGSFGNFAIMATYLILVIPVCGLNFWKNFKCSGHYGRAFYDLALALTGFLLLYLTRCRGPVVALLISFSIFFIYKRWFKALGVMALLCLALLAVVPRSVLIHLDGENKERTVAERMVLWRRAFDVIKKKPLMGTGINTYNDAHKKYDTIRQKNLIPTQDATTIVRKNPNGSVSIIRGDTVLTSDEKQSTLWENGKEYNLVKEPDGRYYKYNGLRVGGYYAHNGYLQLAAEIGLPGLFFFLLFLFIFFGRSLQAIRQVRGSSEEYIQLGLLTALLAFLIYAVTDNNLQSPMSLMKFWYLAGVLMARQASVSLTSGVQHRTLGVKRTDGSVHA